MSKVVTVQLEWKYSPETYLEVPISLSFEGGDLEIKNGVAIAKINSEFYHLYSSIQEKLTQKIENRLYAVQIMTHKDFELSKPTRTDIREDGKKNSFMEVGHFTTKESLKAGNFVIKDKDGIIVADKRRERSDNQKRFAALVDKHRDSDATLDKMLKSYQKSVKDPDDEFVHLFEIIDSLITRLGPKKKAIRKLDITTSEWEEIGKLANNRQLRQGRHRGQAIGALRNAERTELEKARKSGFYLIEKYLAYLES